MASAKEVARRGRPLKFGRRAQLVTLTLPDDVVEWLQTVDDDPAWAVVKLHERATKTRRAQPQSLAELVQLPGQRALILVKPDPFKNLKGISIIPLADGRGFLALDPGRGVADLELAVIDRLEAKAVGAQERDALQRMRQVLKQWRLEGIEFESRSIIVARRQATAARTRGLSSLLPAERH
jgi:hypothetical protein